MPSLCATRTASLRCPGEYMTTDVARCPPVSEALLIVPFVKPSASTRSPTVAASPEIEVPFTTATVILFGATQAVLCLDPVLVWALLFDAGVPLGLLLPVTIAGTLTAAAAPSIRPPVTQSPIERGFRV